MHWCFSFFYFSKSTKKSIYIYFSYRSHSMLIIPWKFFLVPSCRRTYFFILLGDFPQRFDSSFDSSQKLAPNQTSIESKNHRYHHYAKGNIERIKSMDFCFGGRRHRNITISPDVRALEKGLRAMITQWLLICNLMDIVHWSTRILPFVQGFQDPGLGFVLDEATREGD